MTTVITRRRHETLRAESDAVPRRSAAIRSRSS
jgi:hypothetical protein